MLKFGVTAAAGIFAATMLAGQVQAAAPVCTGTTKIAASGGIFQGTDLSGGNCVEAGDKIFGSVTTQGQITGQGTAQFTFASNTGDITIAFLGSLLPGQNGGVTYSVAIDPAKALGNKIVGIQKDFTFSGTGSATLTGTLNGGAPFTCTRPGGITVCPVTQLLTPVSDLTVTQAISNNTLTVTALTDTIKQAVPEPASLLILGSALLGMGLLRRRRRV